MDWQKEMYDSIIERISKLEDAVSSLNIKTAMAAGAIVVVQLVVAIAIKLL